MLTGALVRAARALLGMEQREVAELAGVSTATVRRIEAVDGVPAAHTQSLTAIRRMFEERNVVFIAHPMGDGLLLRRPGGEADQLPNIPGFFFL